MYSRHKSCVIEEQNRTLTIEYIEQEIKQALFMLNLLGAFGPDSFLGWFYQKHWPSISKKVITYALDVLNHKCSLDCVNDTFITLITKIKVAQNVGDFRPISLRNVVYKLIAKV